METDFTDVLTLIDEAAACAALLAATLTKLSTRLRRSPSLLEALDHAQHESSERFQSVS